MEEEECTVYTRACVEAKSLGVDELTATASCATLTPSSLCKRCSSLSRRARPELGGQCIVNMTFSPLPWAPVAEAREHLSALGALP